MKYIEYDDSESLYSDFNDETLRLVERFMGPDVRDMLLVPLVEYGIIIDRDRLITESA